MGKGEIFVTSLPTLPFIKPLPVPFLLKSMVNNINNFGVINFYENNSESKKDQAKPQVEDILPVAEPIDSIIFTKKAKKEAKEATIIAALQKSVQGRNDKTRAFVDELHSWQKEQYIDAHFNARVMFDELNKLMPIAFGYDTFRKYYNNRI